MRKMKKLTALVLSAVLLVTATVAGTLAWFTDKTATITNTFTVGKVDINLAETTGSDYKMIPGKVHAKNPTVTVTADSEDCYLFVKIEKSANLDDFITYKVAAGWTELTGVTGVYYREAKANDTFAVLKDNKVTVKTTVTNEMMTANGFTAPTLKFTAYAVQKEGVASAAAAWELI